MYALLQRRAPLVTVVSYVLLCGFGFTLIFSRAGGSLPWSHDGYRVSFVTADTKNLVAAGEVRVAGVTVGRVVSTKSEGGEAHVTIKLDKEVAPLHQGVTVRIGLKSILGQSYVDVVDGTGAAIPDRANLDPSATIPAVDIDEVINTFDPTTKAALSGTLAGLGDATAGRQQDVDDLFTGLGSVGREGYTTLNALVEQKKSLQALVAETDTILGALDSGKADLAKVITSAQKVTNATASHSPAIESTVRALPGLLSSVREATGALGALSGDLQPVAQSLRLAAPDLNDALTTLPATTRALDGLVPDLDLALKRAPTTLEAVPGVAKDVSSLVPQVQPVLLDLIPMVEYLGPYARDIGSFFGNFGASFDRPMENGVRPVSLAPIFNEYSLRNVPLRIAELNPLHWLNAYPSPGTAENPRPFKGKYPHVDALSP